MLLVSLAPHWCAPGRDRTAGGGGWPAVRSAANTYSTEKIGPRDLCRMLTTEGVDWAVKRSRVRWGWWLGGALTLWLLSGLLFGSEVFWSVLGYSVILVFFGGQLFCLGYGVWWDRRQARYAREWWVRRQAQDRER